MYNAPVEQHQYNPRTGDPERAITDHRRQWRDCLYVYPVVSRRAGGLSVGVNISPDKRCNFACLYCQVDRFRPRNLYDVDIDQLRDELNLVLAEAADDRIWTQPRFADVPAGMRRINDIAFSGDGEPTASREFDRAVRVAAEAKAAAGLDDVKIVVITNASCLASPQVARALPVLDANNGEIWAKLDAGTQQWFETVNRPHPKLPLDKIVADITAVAKDRPVVIQTLFFRVDGAGPESAEIDAYIDRLRNILAGGGQIRLVQIHTIARSPLSPRASTLPNAELDAIAANVRVALGDLAVETYYGHDAPPQQRV